MKGKKIKLCINSNIADAEFIEKLKKKFKIITVKTLIPKNLSASDEEIITRANKKDYHIITKNTKHFKTLFNNSPNLKIGIIGLRADHMEIYPRLEQELLVKEIVSHENLYNKFYELDLEGYKLYYKDSIKNPPKKKWKN